MSAERNKKGLIINVPYAKEEVRRPIVSKVIVEKIESLPGSTAGAGSGDFLQYRNLKKREEARVEQMEIEYRQKIQQDEFERIRNAHIQESAEKTLKKSLKRKKKKDRKLLRKKSEDECKKKQKVEETEKITENIENVFEKKQKVEENEKITENIENVFEKKEE